MDLASVDVAPFQLQRPYRAARSVGDEALSGEEIEDRPRPVLDFVATAVLECYADGDRTCEIAARLLGKLVSRGFLPARIGIRSGAAGAGTVTKRSLAAGGSGREKTRPARGAILRRSTLTRSRENDAICGWNLS